METYWVKGDTTYKVVCDSLKNMMDIWWTDDQLKCGGKNVYLVFCVVVERQGNTEKMINQFRYLLLNTGLYTSHYWAQPSYRIGKVFEH